MLVDFSKVDHTYLVCGFTDLRNGIDILASLVHSHYQLDLYENAVFLFCGRRTDRFKALHLMVKAFGPSTSVMMVGNLNGIVLEKRSPNCLPNDSTGCLTDFQLINSQEPSHQTHEL